MLLVQMLRDMRKAGSWDDEQGSKDGLGAESMFEQIDVELASHLAKVRGLGLADELTAALEKLQRPGGAAGQMPAAFSMPAVTAAVRAAAPTTAAPSATAAVAASSAPADAHAAVGVPEGGQRGAQPAVRASARASAMDSTHDSALDSPLDSPLDSAHRGAAAGNALIMPAGR